MSTMNPLRDILNNDPADAIDVEYNFNTIESFIETEVIRSDGLVAMDAPLTLDGNGATLPAHAVSKAELDAYLPAGAMIDYGGSGAPAGDWLLCNGAVVEQAEYTALYAAIGDLWDDGETAIGGTQFQLPNFQDDGRFAVGGTAVGSYGGLADTIIPAHGHTQSLHGHGPVTLSVNDHFHSVGSLATQGAGGHNHGWGNNRFFYDQVAPPGTNPWGLMSNPSSAKLTEAFFSAEGDHGHTMVGQAGEADRVLSATGTLSDEAPAIQDATGGEDPTDKNYPPFGVVTKIIRY